MAHVPYLALLPFLAGALIGAEPSVIELRIANETVPAGGTVQIKIFLAAPTPILTGRIVMKLDPAVFGPIASVNVLSATGDAFGYAKVEGQQVDAHFTSLSGGVGRLRNQPVMMISVPVLPGAVRGLSAPVIVDSGGTRWKDVDGTEYGITAKPGAVTVGGVLSIQSVTPGGGLLPSGTPVVIVGTGFAAGVSVEVEGAAISPARYISEQQISLSMSARADLNGKLIRVSNPDGTQVEFFSSLNTTVVETPSDTTLAALRPILPLRPVSATRLGSLSPGTAIVLANQNVDPVEITFTALGMRDQVMKQSKITLPPEAIYVRDAVELGNLYLRVLASAPVRMLQLAYSSSPAGAFDAQPVTPLPPPVQQLSVSPITLSWEWQVGSSRPAAQSVSVCSSGETLPFTVSVSTDAGGKWLSAPVQGTSLLFNRGCFSPNFVVTVDPAGLAAGVYTGTVTLTPLGTNPKPSVIQVSLNATALPFITVDRAGLNFNAPLGDPPPQPKTLQIDSNGEPAKFTVTAGTASWLSVTASADTTPATLTVSANPAGLALGNYSGSLTIRGPANERTIAVMLQVYSPLPPPSFGPMTADPAALSFSAQAGGPAPDPGVVAVHPVFAPVTAAVESGAAWLAASVNAGIDWTVSISVRPSG
ncbi:MAG TPA: hypothetical protein VGL77_08660, partial [Armatimonadota bacterium]